VTRIFKETSVLSVFAAVLFAIVLHAHLLIKPIAISVNATQSVLGWLVKTYILQLQPFAISLIFISVLLAQAIRLNVLLNTNKLFTKNTFTVVFSYLLVSSLLPFLMVFTEAFLINSLLIWIIIKCFRLYNNPAAKGLIFNIGLLSSICVLLYPPTIFVVLFCLVVLAIIRPFRLGEWFIFLLGVLSIWYLAISILFLTDKLHLLSILLPKMYLLTPIKDVHYWFWMSLGSLALLLLGGFKYWYDVTNRMVIQMRKSWGVVLIFLVLSWTSIFFSTPTDLQNLWLCCVPLACFVANFFLYSKRNWLVNILFITCIAISAYNNWQLIVK
jgi:hypothetical protein